MSSAPASPPPTGARNGALFDARQILLPLAVAGLFTLAIIVTLLRFHDPAQIPSAWNRYLDNGFCQAMFALFLAASLYALLQAVGLQVEHARLRNTGQRRAAVTAQLLDWLAYVSGRQHCDRHTLPSELPIGDYLALVRTPQHRHNFAPLGFVVWVLPLLGFIGTVVGIAQAIGGLEQTVGAASAGDTGLDSVLAGLRFAFDTTFIGLLLTIPTMLYALALRMRAHAVDMLFLRPSLTQDDREDA